MAAHGGVEILSRGYYVLGDTRTPVAVAIGSMITNLVLAAALVGPLEVEGLALAVSIAAAIESLVLLLLLGRRIDGLVTRGLALGVGRMLLATGVMAIVVAVLEAVLHAAGLQRHDTRDALVVLALGGAGGALVYLLSTLALGLEEPGQIAGRLPFLRWLLSRK
jgi:putative peptidoglycan lipid II flippase